jgi:hypothetical protein
MSKEDVYIHDYLEFKKLKFWKDRDLRHLRKLLNKRYEYRYALLPTSLDMQIELQKRLVELNRNIEIGTLGRVLNKIC